MAESVRPPDVQYGTGPANFIKNLKDGQQFSNYELLFELKRVYDDKQEHDVDVKCFTRMDLNTEQKRIKFKRVSITESFRWILAYNRVERVVSKCHVILPCMHKLQFKTLVGFGAAQVYRFMYDIDIIKGIIQKMFRIECSNSNLILIISFCIDDTFKY